MDKKCMQATLSTQRQRDTFQNLRAPTDATLTRATQTLEDETMIRSDIDGDQDLTASNMGAMAMGERAGHAAETCLGSLVPRLMCDVSTNCI